jgi:hypothetical protein
MSRYYRSAILAVVFLALAALIPSSPAATGSSGIVPVNKKFQGLSYSDWEAKWWQALIAIPASPDHPFFVGGAFGDEEGIVFLTGAVPSTPGGTVEVEITIPAGTALFFPMLNTECSSVEAPPFFGKNGGQQRKCARGLIANPQDVFAELDGQSLQNPEDYYTESSQFTINLPEDNILLGPGTGPVTGTSVDAGFYLLLTPLSVGNHTLHFGGQFSAEAGGLVIDTTYYITVTP